MRGATVTTAGIAAALLLAACSRSDPQLMHLTPGRPGPDEFLILPTKPLEAPPNYSALPEPTPGGTNLADPVPAAEVATALGGKASAVERRGVPASDGALIASAGRYGVQGDIRSQLAAEDLAFRKNHRGRLLERLFDKTVYFQAYKSQELDQYAELARLRALGLQTAQVPPKPQK